jgi:hypothetical protein
MRRAAITKAEGREMAGPSNWPSVRESNDRGHPGHFRENLENSLQFILVDQVKKVNSATHNYPPLINEKRPLTHLNSAGGNGPAHNRLKTVWNNGSICENWDKVSPPRQREVVKYGSAPKDMQRYLRREYGRKSRSPSRLLREGVAKDPESLRARESV